MNMLSDNNTSVPRRQIKCLLHGYLEGHTLAYGDATVDIWYRVGWFQFRGYGSLVYI
jgi:hypothetical protein